jgi:hypothetical protein
MLTTAPKSPPKKSKQSIYIMRIKDLASECFDSNVCQICEQKNITRRTTEHDYRLTRLRVASRIFRYGTATTLHKSCFFVNVDYDPSIDDIDVFTSEQDADQSTMETAGDDEKMTNEVNEEKDRFPPVKDETVTETVTEWDAMNERGQGGNSTVGNVQSTEKNKTCHK